jgi:ketosteroid isomerase-like protein
LDEARTASADWRCNFSPPGIDLPRVNGLRSQPEAIMAKRVATGKKPAGGGKAQAKRTSRPAAGKKLSDSDKIAAANLAYYRALSARDIAAMAEVWTRAADNILIAPPVHPITYVGWAAICRNWEVYWPTFDRFSVSMEVTTINVNGPVAWVHGIELSKRHTKSGETSSSRNFGTNIFVLVDGEWRMVFHQAAVIPD